MKTTLKQDQKQRTVNDQQVSNSDNNREEQIKISKMKPEDRHAYTCAEKFSFRKGSDKFKDCIFELYKAEAELEKLELQKQVAKANADAARANAEAARAGAERQERLALAQTEAAKMQALAARQQAIAANTADSLALIESGLRMMSPQRPAPRMQTTCTYTGSFMNCF
jgi:multidrug efflux pump subunit AcrA (membrane-fusion protein)